MADEASTPFSIAHLVGDPRTDFAEPAGSLTLAPKGGEIVAVGTPEQVAKEKRSYTGQFLKPVLEKARPGKRARDAGAQEAAE